MQKKIGQYLLNRCSLAYNQFSKEISLTRWKMSVRLPSWSKISMDEKRVWGVNEGGFILFAINRNLYMPNVHWFFVPIYISIEMMF